MNADFYMFLKDLEKLCDTVHSYRKELIVNQRIDLFYYMQKIEVLKFLGEQAQKGDKSLSVILDSELKAIRRRWAKDSEWLNKYLANRGLI